MTHAVPRAWGRGCGAVLLVLVATAPAGGAGTRAKECRSSCDLAIAVCVQQGYRKRFCTREVGTLCRQGNDICTVSVPPGACLGAAACSLEPTNVTSTVGSAAELRQRILGLWYDCRQPSSRAPLGGDAAGIEFSGDGNWYFLRLQGSTLVRKNGFGEAGTYEIVDTTIMNGPGHFQLRLSLNSGGYFYAVWALAETPQMLQLDNMGVQTALYAHMPGAPACAQVCL